MSYHIIYIPQVLDRSKHSVGNGGKKGCSVGTRATVSNSKSLLNIDGCLRHHIDHCETCPRQDCDYDYMIEFKLRKGAKNENRD